jgi:hypothetical protein
LDRKLLYTLISIGAVVIMAVTLSRLPAASREGQEAASHVEADLPQLAARGEESAPAPAYEYIVKEYNGHIAVFLHGAAEPQMILATQVKFLPDYDRTAIAEGIPVSSFEELSALLEDFTS